MENIWKSIIRAVFVLIGLSPVAVIIYFALFRTLTKDYLLLVVGAELAVLLFLFGIAVLHAVATEQIRIDKLIAEQNGDASASRFQLMIFTFTIALSFVYLVLMGPGKFPDIPNQVLILLGLSASTYGVGKGLQILGNANSPAPQVPPAPGPNNQQSAPPAPGPDNQQPKPPGDAG